jgi:hypothetical protein
LSYDSDAPQVGSACVSSFSILVQFF